MAQKNPSYTATSAPIQFSAVVAFTGSAFIERYLMLSRRVLSALGRHCAKVLKEAGLEVAPLAGAFDLFPSFRQYRDRLRDRGIRSSLDLSNQLLEQTGVATIPDSSFGRPQTELTLRMTCVEFDGGSALTAANRIEGPGELDEAFVHRHCPRVTDTMDRVAAWVHAARGQP